jgi:hypothetical protein
MYQTKPAGNYSGSTGDIKMFTLLALIKREIYDNIIYLAGGLLLAALGILIAVTSVVSSEKGYGIEGILAALFYPSIIVLLIGFPAMGVTQMYIDKNRKISAFLLTLPTTRSMIFAAKIIAGVLTILVFFIPLIVTTKILYGIYGPPIPVYEDMIFDISSIIILTAFACYCVGLQTGWTTSRIFPTFGSIALTVIVITLVIIKGFGLHAWIILGAFILASLVRSWQKFSTTAL